MAIFYKKMKCNNGNSDNLITTLIHLIKDCRPTTNEIRFCSLWFFGLSPEFNVQLSVRRK